MRKQFEELKLIVVDEMSMVSSDVLYKILFVNQHFLVKTKDSWPVEEYGTKFFDSKLYSQVSSWFCQPIFQERDFDS